VIEPSPPRTVTAGYSAHTIAADALWAGLPLLACPQDTFSVRACPGRLSGLLYGRAGGLTATNGGSWPGQSRVSASMLAGAGLAELPLPGPPPRARAGWRSPAQVSAIVYRQTSENAHGRRMSKTLERPRVTSVRE
jgi:hypothetical protein